MKLLHLGDLHLGRSLGDYDLYDDQEYILKEIIRIVKERQVDAVLIAGDVYDKAVPSEAATNLLDFFLKELAGCGVSTFAISGNHDSDDRLNYGSRLFQSNNIFIAAKYEGELCKHTVTDAYGEVNFYLLPFVKASQVRHYHEEEDIEDYNDAVRCVINRAAPDPSSRNVLVAHQYVGGKGIDPIRAGSEGLSVQTVGTVERIDSDCFECFDYVALGHIHSPQALGRETIRYSGSPLKYSLSEVYNNKSVPIITLGAKGETQVELVPLTPKRDVRHITGYWKEIIDEKNIQNPEDYVYVTLRDEEYLNDVMGTLQHFYPNAVALDYDNSTTRAKETADISCFTEEKPFEELFTDFYQQIYGQDISEEELVIMRSVAREAGVFHEAD